MSIFCEKANSQSHTANVFKKMIRTFNRSRGQSSSSTRSSSEKTSGTTTPVVSKSKASKETSNQLELITPKQNATPKQFAKKRNYTVSAQGKVRNKNRGSDYQMNGGGDMPTRETKDTEAALEEKKNGCCRCMDNCCGRFWTLCCWCVINSKT